MLRDIMASILYYGISKGYCGSRVLQIYVAIA